MKIEEDPEALRIANGMLDSIEDMCRRMPAGCEMRVYIGNNRAAIEFWINGFRMIQRERDLSGAAVVEKFS